MAGFFSKLFGGGKSSGTSPDTWGALKLGMTKNEMISAIGPLKQGTYPDQLASSNVHFLGRQVHTNFRFDANDKLEQIQMWLFNGEGYGMAVQRMFEAYKVLKDHYGNVETGDIDFSKYNSSYDLEKMEMPKLYAEWDKNNDIRKEISLVTDRKDVEVSVSYLSSVPGPGRPPIFYVHFWFNKKKN